MARAGYLKNRRGTQSIRRLPPHGNRGDEASVSGKDYRHDGRRWVQLAGSDQAEEVRQYITPARTKSRYERNADTNVFTDALLKKLEGIGLDGSQNPDWDDIQNKPDLYHTTEIFNENVSVPAPLEWVELSESYPDAEDADWLLVDVDGKDSIRVRIATVLANPAGTAGATLITAQSVCKASSDLWNFVYFGRTSSSRILFSTGDADGDGISFSPNPLIIEQIDKQDEG